MQATSTGWRGGNCVEVPEPFTASLISLLITTSLAACRHCLATNITACSCDSLVEEGHHFAGGECLGHACEACIMQWTETTRLMEMTDMHI